MKINRPSLQFLATLAMAAPAEAASFQYTLLNAPGFANTFSIAINSHDQIVGEGVLANGTAEGFVWSNGNFTTVPGSSYLSAINNEGLAAGSVYRADGYVVSYDTVTGKFRRVNIDIEAQSPYVTGIDANNDFSGTVEISQGKKDRFLGYLLSGGVTTVIAPHGAKYSLTYAMNEAGTIVLGCEGGAKPCPSNWIYQKGTYTRFAPPRNGGQSGSIASTFINSDGTLGGTVDYAITGFSGFVRQNGAIVLYNVPGAHDTHVSGVGPAGQIVGNFTSSRGIAHGFVFSNGTYTQIDYPGAANTTLGQISPSGSVLGVYYDADDTPHGFIAQCTTGQVCTQ